MAYLYGIDLILNRGGVAQPAIGLASEKLTQVHGEYVLINLTSYSLYPITPNT